MRTFHAKKIIQKFHTGKYLTENVIEKKTEEDFNYISIGKPIESYTVNRLKSSSTINAEPKVNESSNTLEDFEKEYLEFIENLKAKMSMSSEESN